MNYVGIDWAYRRAAWCAVNDGGAIKGEGMIPADEGGLAHLVLELGSEVKACVETMSGAVWVKDQLELGGWSVSVAGNRVAPDRGHPAALEQLHRIGLGKAGETDPKPELGEQAEDPVSMRAPVPPKDSRGELLALSDRLTVLHGIERPRQLPRTLCATSAAREMSPTHCTGSARGR